MRRFKTFLKESSPFDVSGYPPFGIRAGRNPAQSKQRSFLPAGVSVNKQTGRVTPWQGFRNPAYPDTVHVPNPNMTQANDATPSPFKSLYKDIDRQRQSSNIETSYEGGSISPFPMGIPWHLYDPKTELPRMSQITRNFDPEHVTRNPMPVPDKGFHQTPKRDFDYTRDFPHSLNVIDKRKSFNEAVDKKKKDKKKEEPEVNLVQLVGNRRKQERTNPKVHHYKAPPHDIPSHKKRSSEFGGMSFYGPGER